MKRPLRNRDSSSNGNQLPVVMIGCFDTKGEDFAYLYKNLLSQGLKVLTINTGVLETQELFPIDYDAEMVAQSGGVNLGKVRQRKDRGYALEIMGQGASKILEELSASKKIAGVIAMGGGGGTFVTIKAMEKVSFGIPKICISTLATKDLSDKIRDKDIVLIPSIVDVAGLNKISRVLISQAAGALSGMISADILDNKKLKGSIAMSVFGNTSICADSCTEIFKSKGYDVLSFHAVGTGGMTMESLIKDQVFDAVLDLTTTELADELCGGICSSGPDRLTAASYEGIPQVVVPGCLDMVNFGAMDTVPEKYKDRQLFSWAPDVTLMRTNEEENKILGESIAQKLSKSTGPVTLVLPLGGISKIGGMGETFYNPQIDQVLFDALKKNVSEKVKIVEVDTNINTPEFAEQVAQELLNLINKE